MMPDSRLLLRAVPVLTASLCFSSAALASDDRPWTLSAGYSQVFSQDADAGNGPTSGFAAIDRRFGATSVSLSAGVTKRDLLLPDAATLIDASSYSVGGSIAQSLGDATIALSVDHARENGAVSVLLPTGSVLPAEARNRYWAVTGSLAQTFGDRLRVTPSASGGWSRAATAIEIAGPAAPFAIARDDSGVSASAGATLGVDAGARVSLFVGAYGIYAENAGSVFQVTSAGPRGANAGSRALQSFGDSGSDAWGEVTAGTAIAFDRATFGVDAVASVGLEQDFVALTASASLSF